MSTTTPTTPQPARPPPRPRVVGLIGGIGSGKSAVAQLFAERGARIISGDQAGHEALRQPSLRRKIVERWGPGVVGPDGEVDRRRLAAIVFADPTERRVLEEWVFPWIRQRLEAEIAAAVADPAVPLVIVDAAVMLEARWDSVCDAIIYVHAPRALRLKRLAEHRGWSEAEVLARERAQWPLAEKVARADWVVDNSGGRDELARQVDDLLRLWAVAPTNRP
ncbi:MAG: dephospho-CoA kinase [Gemmataceae bacterium]|nr:dephospho-CoA kinase [Gemmataceae bacterium]MDW8266892.1 dephospho-CoA kinase [Gemmataceae bacterium]